MEELMGKETPTKTKLKEWGKVALYTGALVGLYAGASYANFETQITKASDLTLGKLAAMAGRRCCYRRWYTSERR